MTDSPTLALSRSTLEASRKMDSTTGLPCVQPTAKQRPTPSSREPRTTSLLQAPCHQGCDSSSSGALVVVYQDALGAGASGGGSGGGGADGTGGLGRPGMGGEGSPPPPRPAPAAHLALASPSPAVVAAAPPVAVAAPVVVPATQRQSLMAPTVAELRWLRWTIALWLASAALPWLQWALSLWRGAVLRAELASLRWWSLAQRHSAARRIELGPSRPVLGSWRGATLQASEPDEGRNVAHELVAIEDAWRQSLKDEATFSREREVAWCGLARQLVVFIAWAGAVERALHTPPPANAPSPLLTRAPVQVPCHVPPHAPICRRARFVGPMRPAVQGSACGSRPLHERVFGALRQGLTPH